MAPTHCLNCGCVLDPKIGVNGRKFLYCSLSCKNKTAVQRRRDREKISSREKLHYQKQIETLAAYIAQHPPHDPQDILTVLNRVRVFGYRQGAAEAFRSFTTLKNLTEKDEQLLILLTTGFSF